MIRKAALRGRVAIGGTMIALAASASLFAATPALAVTQGTLSTTGASGEYRYQSGSATWALGARDTVSDSHCAQWQVKHSGSSTWVWTGARECAGTQTWVGVAGVSDQVRICRTGTGNCSTAVKLTL